MPLASCRITGFSEIYHTDTSATYWGTKSDNAMFGRSADINKLQKQQAHDSARVDEIDDRRFRREYG
jgi:hypothetical protein